MAAVLGGSEVVPFKPSTTASKWYVSKLAYGILSRGWNARRQTCALGPRNSWKNEGHKDNMRHQSFVALAHDTAYSTHCRST